VTVVTEFVSGFNDFQNGKLTLKSARSGGVGGGGAGGGGGVCG